MVKVKRLAFSGLLAILGFVLSPFSWWNDLLINVPLAYAMSAVISLAARPFWITSPADFTALMIVNYWITNVLGLYLMHAGYSVAKHKTHNLTSDIIVGSIYTVLIIFVAVIGVTIIHPSTLQIFPHWVQ